MEPVESIESGPVTEKPGIVVLAARIDAAELARLRPSQGNLSVEIQDPLTRDAVRKITSDSIGSGEALS